ncbi:hypothetical protein GZL_03397 [Streptomyces sp. 769]|nr:hypothetical protein GZL_03397 [Streptomyces sp. 769]
MSMASTGAIGAIGRPYQRDELGLLLFVLTEFTNCH